MSWTRLSSTQFAFNSSPIAWPSSQPLTALFSKVAAVYLHKARRGKVPSYLQASRLSWWIRPDGQLTRKRRSIPSVKASAVDRGAGQPSHAQHNSNSRKMTGTRCLWRRCVVISPCWASSPLQAPGLTNGPPQSPQELTLACPALPPPMPMRRTSPRWQEPSVAAPGPLLACPPPTLL